MVNEGTSEPADDELVLQRAVEHAMRQIESERDSHGDTERLQATLTGLIDSAVHWRYVGDLSPHVRVFRDLGMSVLLQLFNELPQYQYQRFREWIPENWHEKRYLDLNMALNIMNEGIPLIWVPQSWVVSNLLKPGDTQMRSGILVDRYEEIGRGCLVVLREVINPGLAELTGFAIDAVQELMNGHFRSAQALAGNILDTWMRGAVDRGVFGARDRTPIYSYVRGNVPRLSHGTLVEQFRRACVLAPVAVALQDYWSPNPPPVIFNRHATAHRVGLEQYTQANAVISVMLVSSVLREDEASGL